MLWRLKSGRRRLELGIDVRRRAEGGRERAAGGGGGRMAAWATRAQAGWQRAQRPAEEDGRGRRRTAEEDGGTAWAVNGAEDGGGGRMAAWAARAQAGWQRRGQRPAEEDGGTAGTAWAVNETAWAQTGNQSSYGVLLIIHTRVRVREGVCEKNYGPGFSSWGERMRTKKGRFVSFQTPPCSL